MDGFQPSQGKFTASGSYSVNSVYIVVNNLPFYPWMLIENMILMVVLSSPKEPKGHTLDQILELLVDDLIVLSNGLY
ncbi:hypothetical protein FS749_005776 [Ceratobasidium sp. UAMH 11750]|nr:hypothetical protein FS749_005776 [Ceratobasidium sp. UAMH 11750]